MKKWVLPVVCAMIGAAVSLYVYGDLPERMAIHFNAASMPDRWVSKPVGAFAMPVMILLYALLSGFSHKLEKDENKRLRAAALSGTINAVVIVVLLTVHALIIAHNLDAIVPSSTMAAAIVGALFIVFGNMLPRMPQRKLQWPRLTEAQYRKAARFQGRLMFVIGIVFLLLCLAPQSVVFPAITGLLIVFFLAVIGSLIRYSRTG